MRSTFKKMDCADPYLGCSRCSFSYVPFHMFPYGCFLAEIILDSTRKAFHSNLVVQPDWHWEKTEEPPIHCSYYRSASCLFLLRRRHAHLLTLPTRSLASLPDDMAGIAIRGASRS
jgi:hypothetical protein